MSKLTKLLILLVFSILPALTLSQAESQYLALFDVKEVRCLARAIYFEARGESVEGKKAVAIVTVNRANHPSFPNTVCKAVYQKGQYSWTADKVRVTDQKAWKESEDIAFKVLNNYDSYKSFKALYFHNTSVNPKWKRKRIAKIGNHVFYA